MKIIRVFPRKTNCTPDDELVRFSYPGMFDEADEVHVSVTWTWDMKKAEQLAKQWEHVAPVKIGGPGTGMRGEDFTPGMYVKRGYVITSRGCPNNCWFCSVPKRDGDIRELPITEGWNVLDDNLLACSDEHIKAVFDMLSKQTERIQFTGGLEAARLQQWHADRMKQLRTKQAFFAYDTPGDREPLFEAGKMLKAAGFTMASKALRCYVLIGYKGDTAEKAYSRMIYTLKAGFWPMAMYWRDGETRRSITKEWHDFQWLWSRPAAMNKTYRELDGVEERGFTTR